MVDDNLLVRVEADTAPFERALTNLSRLSEGFGRQLTSALQGAVVSGRSLDDILRRIGLNLAGMALQQGLQPLQNLTSSLLGNAMGRITPFASGGVVSAPTYFPMRGGTGLMGEAGPEAILPLRRGPDGNLGVAASGGSGSMNIVFNVTTPDASSFVKSQAQVSGMLARAVTRGARGL